VDIVLYSSLLRVVLLSDVPLVFSTVFDALLYCSPISRLSASLAPDFTFTDFRCFFRFASFSLFRVSFRLSEQCCHDHSLLYHSPLSRAFLVRMARIFSRFMLVLNCRKWGLRTSLCSTVPYTVLDTILDRRLRSLTLFSTVFCGSSTLHVSATRTFLSNLALITAVHRAKRGDFLLHWGLTMHMGAVFTARGSTYDETGLMNILRSPAWR